MSTSRSGSWYNAEIRSDNLVNGLKQLILSAGGQAPERYNGDIRAHQRRKEGARPLQAEAEAAEGRDREGKFGVSEPSHAEKADDVYDWRKDRQRLSFESRVQESQGKASE